MKVQIRKGYGWTLEPADKGGKAVTKRAGEVVDLPEAIVRANPQYFKQPEGVLPEAVIDLDPPPPVPLPQGAGLPPALADIVNDPPPAKPPGKK